MAKKAKSITVISDHLMEPYYITKDDLCYTVNERITPNKDHFRSKGEELNTLNLKVIMQVLN